MSIPDYETLMLPLLKFTSDGKEHSNTETVEYLSKLFNLTDEELRVMIPSGQSPLFKNRIHWAKTYMKHALFLDITRRGYFQITERGKSVIKNNPQKIDRKFLMQFPEFVDFQKRSKVKSAKFEEDNNHTSNSTSISNQTPEEILTNSHQEIHENLAQELLKFIKSSTPAFFERLVLDLLINMGYGGSIKDAGEAVGKTGDGGIDGIIKEDHLGLDVIYIQAKKWEGTVRRPEVQKFAGALQGNRAKKGVFLTTGQFSTQAIDFAQNIDSRIILVDGNLLTKLMIEHDVGVSIKSTYKVKRIDTDYFEDEE